MKTSVTTKRIGMAAAALVAAACLASAQSPPASASVTLGGKTISIRYSSPSVRGRKIFGDGGLLSRDPTYPAWRAGANAATSFKTDATLDVGGLTVPAGSYTLYAWVKDPDAWQLIISKQTGQWGLTYTPSMDLGRVKMTMSTPPELVERLKYTLTDKGGGAGELRLEWEHHAATVPIRVK
jgi:predicted acylesterase/phospholipase RssA